MWLGRRLHQVATPKKTEENSSNKSKLKKVLLLPDATPQECREVINENLNSSSMLVILPLQDWLSTNPKARSKYPESERINNPTNSNNYWRYRMEINLEELI
jgi:4-alpha-glucanotransferase